MKGLKSFNASGSSGVSIFVHRNKGIGQRWPWKKGRNMPFDKVFVSKEQVAAAQPALRLDQRPTFGQRLVPGPKRDSKVAVACWAVENLLTDGGSAQFTDGSSTFVACSVVSER